MNALKQIISRIINLYSFEKHFLKSIPPAYREAAKLLYFHNLSLTVEERRLGKEIELFRSTIPCVVSGNEIPSYSSPHSSTFKMDEISGHAEPGPFLTAETESMMKVGTSIWKGMLLRRIIEGTKVKRILELGTNSGFSGCYFLSVAGTELVTIEGSKQLCELAQRNISRVSGSYKIMNCLFDIGIDQLIDEKALFDCVFIDGQHEKKATLHYAERVKPLMSNGSIYIYDDIYWSDDMNQAWKELCYNPNNSETVDLFKIGICKQDQNGKGTVHYDIGDCLVRPVIKRKGW